MNGKVSKWLEFQQNLVDAGGHQPDTCPYARHVPSLSAETGPCTTVSLNMVHSTHKTSGQYVYDTSTNGEKESEMANRFDITDDEQFADILAQGENERTEFKRGAEGPQHDTYETICSFANHGGGLIILGIADDGNVVGLDADNRRLKQFQQNIANVLQNTQTFNIAPNAVCQIKEYQGEMLLCIFVENSPEVIQYKGKTYDRVFDSDVKITSTTQLAAICARKTSAYSEATLYPALTLDDFNPRLIDNARRLVVTKNANHPWKNMSDEELLRHSRLWKKNYQTGESGYVLAAALLFGFDEVIASICPTYSIDAVVRILNQDRYDDRLTTHTNLLDAYDELYAFLCRYLPDPFYRENQQRVSSRQIVARELIANIIMHQEYNSPMPAQIEIGTNAIATRNASVYEFEGYLELGDFTPIPKNPMISNVFREIGYADQLGSGIRKLNKIYTVFSDNPPEFHDGPIFTSTFHINAALLTTPSSISAVPDDSDTLAQSGKQVDDVIIRLLAETGMVTAQVVADTAKVTPRTARRHIAPLVSSGQLVRERRPNGTVLYRVNKKAN